MIPSRPDPIAGTASYFLAIASIPGTGSNPKDLIVYAKANPGKVSCRHAGVSTIQHLTGESGPGRNP